MSLEKAVSMSPERLSDKLAIILGGNTSNISTTETFIDGSDTTTGPPDSEDDDSHGIKFKDWGFKIDRLFEVAHRFYKRNESKAFHPSFDIRNQMNALMLQAKYGNYDDGKAPDIGVLDLIGKSRRNEWANLKGMSKAEAMSKFICTLDEICPFFKAYAEAVKISYGSQQSNTTNLSQQADMQTSRSVLDEIESDDQLKAIHTSLCRQTYSQFKSYANKQHPNDPDKQKYLIKALQEQYYLQYISQMNQNSKEKLGATASSEIGSSISSDAVIKNNEASSLVSSGSSEHPVLSEVVVVREQVASSPTQQPLEFNQLEATIRPNDDHFPEQETCSEVYADPEEPSDENESEACGSPLQLSMSFEPLEPATIWTKKGVREFKDSLLDDKHSGSYIVRQGTLLTIQVPTFPDGRYIHWEFVTDDHDIGFGLDFLYETNLERPLALRFHEDTDDDDLDDEEAALDEAVSRQMNEGVEASQSTSNSLIESGSNMEVNLRRLRAERLSNTVCVVPTYRRDSHEEVFVGRHRYPGQGYYLLKFDNTYSVLRSKSLYFRICYFV